MSRTAFYQQIVKQEQLHEKQALEISKDALEHYEIAYSLCHEILFDLEENIDLRDDPDRRAASEIFIRLLGTNAINKMVTFERLLFRCFSS